MNKAILNWIKTSDYDIITATAMLKSKRHLYVIFMCHLSVEKLLKAVVCNVTQKIPHLIETKGFLKWLKQTQELTN